MKITELINQLYFLHGKHGDLPVLTWNADFGDALGLVKTVELSDEWTMIIDNEVRKIAKGGFIEIN